MIVSGLKTGATLLFSRHYFNIQELQSTIN